MAKIKTLGSRARRNVNSGNPPHLCTALTANPHTYAPAAYYGYTVGTVAHGAYRMAVSRARRNWRALPAVPVLAGPQTATSVRRFIAANGGAYTVPVSNQHPHTLVKIGQRVAWHQLPSALMPFAVLTTFNLPPMATMLAMLANGTGALFIRGTRPGPRYNQ
jgi:hypothetical protein